MALSDKVASVQAKANALKTALQDIQAKNEQQGLSPQQLDKIAAINSIKYPNSPRPTVLDLSILADLVVELSDALDLVQEDLAQPAPSPFSQTSAPATATSSGTPGQFNLTATDLFLCVAPNEWVKLTRSSF